MAAIGAAALAKLDALRAKGRLRSLPGTSDACLDLTTNDYLGLLRNAALRQRIYERLVELPHGSGGSRLLGGDLDVFHRLEETFARFKGGEASLFFASGYAANEAVLSSLARLPGVAFFSDELNHASLFDGIRLSALPESRRQVYRHSNMADLREKLAAANAPLPVIVTESLFGMDGDEAPLAALGNLATEFRAALVIDEAHATFCLGEKGRGLAQKTGLEAREMVIIDPCGKAFASQGAFVTGPSWLKEYLLNFARTFMFTTAPSPWAAHALQVTLGLDEAILDAARARLIAVGGCIRESLRSQGWNLGQTTSHIVPVFLGQDQLALQLSAFLKEFSVRAKAIRPPTVPIGAARVRLSLGAWMTDADFDRLISAFERARGVLHA